MNVLNMLEEGQFGTDVARHFGVSINTISCIRKSEEIIRKKSSDHDSISENVFKLQQKQKKFDNR